MQFGTFMRTAECEINLLSNGFLRDAYMQNILNISCEKDLLEILENGLFQSCQKLHQFKNVECATCSNRRYKNHTYE